MNKNDARREGFERFKRAQQQLVAECSTTPLGWLGTGDVMMLAPLGIIAVASCLVGRNYPVVIKVSLVFHALLFVLLWIISLRATSGWARERAWVGALPFPLEGYLPALGGGSDRAGGSHSSGPSTKLAIAVHFKGDAPKDVEALLGGFELIAKTDKQSLHLADDDFPAGGTNYALHKFMRRFATSVLLPLNEKSPVSRVDVTLRN